MHDVILLLTSYFPPVMRIYWLIIICLYLATLGFSCRKKRKIPSHRHLFYAFSHAAFAAYSFLLLAMLVLSRGLRGEYSYNLEPFHTYRRLFAGGPGASEWGALALFNCLLFMPFGFLLAAERKMRRGNGGVRMAAVCGFAYSLLLETLQLVLRRGTCELDDILHNTIGAVLGALLWKAAQALYLNIKRSSARD